MMTMEFLVKMVEMEPLVVCFSLEEEDDVGIYTWVDIDKIWKMKDLWWQSEECKGQGTWFTKKLFQYSPL